MTRVKVGPYQLDLVEKWNMRERERKRGDKTATIKFSGLVRFSALGKRAGGDSISL